MLQLVWVNPRMIKIGISTQTYKQEGSMNFFHRIYGTVNA